MKRDFEALEKRRFEAAALFREGVHQAEVARRLGVHRQSVSRWQRQWEDQGKKGLAAAGRAGRKRKLGDLECRKLTAALKKGPEAFGFSTGLWTLPRIAQVIEKQCGVRYHPGHVWRLLGQLGWSVQRPTGRALERNEKKIARWKSRRWPELKKKPSGKASRSSLSTKAD